MVDFLVVTAHHQAVALTTTAIDGHCQVLHSSHPQLLFQRLYHASHRLFGDLALPYVIQKNGMREEVIWTPRQPFKELEGKGLAEKACPPVPVNCQGIGIGYGDRFARLDRWQSSRSWAHSDD